MRQIETDLRSPLPPQAPLTPPRFDAEQYFAEGGPVHMAGGGFRDPNDPLGGLAVDPNDPRQFLQFGGRDEGNIPTGVPLGQAVGTSLGYHTLESLGHGAEMTKQAIEEGRSPDMSDPEVVGKVLGAAGLISAGGIGGAPARAGEVVLGSGPVRRVAEAAAIERELSPLGFYSHGAETAAGLQQAKGTPQQYYSMLEKSGVKPAELEGFNEAFASRPSVTREEIAAHFKERMPQVEETVLGGSKPDLAKSWETVDRVSNDLFDAGITEHTPIALNTYDINRYPVEARPAVEELAAAHRYIREQSDAGRTFANNPTKFSQYTLPGGENYREVLLKMPSEGAPTVDKKGGSYGFTDSSGRRRDYWSEEEAQQAARSLYRDSGAFKSQHWDDPNVLAHLRMSDRTGPNGEKILHVEEIQSDWGQKGKKEGFKGEVERQIPIALQKIQQADRNVGETFDRLAATGLTEQQVYSHPDFQAAYDQAQAAKKSYGDLNLRSKSNIPEAPYVTNTQAWTDLALKRALREAAEGGYDKLVWTPGAEQAKRYSLSNQVRSIDYMKEGDNSYRLGIVDKRGEGIDLPKETFTAKELEDYLGRDVASKIINDEGQSYRGRNHKSLEGVDLVLGGEGMKGYYDKIVPNQLSKLVKKLDPEAKIEMGRLPVQGETRLAPDIARELGMTVEQIQALPHEQRSALINSVRHSIAAPSLTITPKMREAIMKGQTAYAEGGEVEAAPKKSEPAFRTIDEQVTAVASDLANIARKDNLDQRHVAYLLKVASGMYMPPERAMEFAGQIMLGDAEGLISRFKTYRPSIRTFARLNQMMGGKHKFMSGDHMGGAMMRMKGEEALMRTKENAESVMDSDVVKSRPAMKKALEAFNKRI
jgi:hypothetical protein